MISYPRLFDDLRKTLAAPFMAYMSNTVQLLKKATVNLDKAALQVQ
jgi:hypothetical protein